MSADVRKTLEESVAASLHAGAIRLLRRLRLEDVRMGLGTARASVLSVLVFAGPKTVSELASLEQVRPPTMTRLLDRLERDGLVERERRKEDRRSVRIRATAQGQRVLHAGRARRVGVLARDLRGLSDEELRILERAAPVLEKIAGKALEGPKR